MYNEAAITNKHISKLLPRVLKKIAKAHHQRPDLILLAWPQLIGEKLAPMTKAVAFTEGVLLVKVQNSSLYSLLAQYEKKRLLQSLRSQFPSVQIKDLLFRLG